jgi:hypothetical protein
MARLSCGAIGDKAATVPVSPSMAAIPSGMTCFKILVYIDDHNAWE